MPTWEEIEQNPRIQSLSEHDRGRVQYKHEQNEKAKEPVDPNSFEAIESNPRYRALDSEKQSTVRSKWREKNPQKTNLFGGLADIGQGLVRAPLDAATSIASAFDDPTESTNLLDIPIESRRKTTEAYISAPGAEEKAFPLLPFTRREIRSGMSSLGYSGANLAITLGAKAGATALGAAAGVPEGVIGSVPGAIAGYAAGAAVGGVVANRMDVNAFTREVREDLENKEQRKIYDSEFKNILDDESNNIKRYIAEHGMHEATWEALGNVVELATLGRIKGGKLTTKALKGLASIVGVELATETQTQIGQHNIEAKLGMTKEGERSFLSVKDQLKSAREVLPGVLLAGGTMTGGKALYEKATQKGREEVKLKKVYADTKTENLKALNKKDLTGAQLANLMRDPDALSKWAVTEDDIQKEIDKSPAKQQEQKDFNALLDMAPNDSVRNGLASAHLVDAPDIADLKQPDITELEDPANISAKDFIDQAADRLVTLKNKQTVQPENLTVQEKSDLAVLESDVPIKDKAKALGVSIGEQPVTTEQPTVAEPIVAEPTVAEPTVAEPIVAEPTVAEPTVAEPTVVEPVTAEQPVTAKELSLEENIKLVEDEIRTLGTQAYEAERKGEDATEIYTRQAELEATLETVPKDKRPVDSTKKSIEGLEYDAQELYKQIESSDNPEEISVLQDQLTTVEAQIKQSTDQGITEDVSVSNEVPDFERQLELTQKNIDKQNADIADLPAYKTGRKGAIKADTLNQQIPAYLQEAKQIPIAKRTTESLKQESSHLLTMMKHHSKLAEVVDDPNLSMKEINIAINKAEDATDKAIGTSQLKLSKRFLNVVETLKGRSKPALKPKPTKKAVTSTQIKEDSKQDDLEPKREKASDTSSLRLAEKAIKRAKSVQTEIDALQPEIDALQPEIDKARKGKKKSSHLVAKQAELRTKMDLIIRDALASEVGEVYVAKSSTNQVESSLLKSLSLKKIPNVFKVYGTYAEFAKANPEAVAAYKGDLTLENIIIQKPKVADEFDIELTDKQQKTLGSKPAGLQYKGKIYLIAENIDSDQNIKGLVIHESGHWLRRNDKNYESKYQALLAQAQKIAKSESPEGLAMREAAIKAFNLNSDRLSLELVNEEALMYFLQDQANVELPLYKKVISLVKQFIFKHFNVAPIKLNMSGYEMGQVVANDIKKAIKERSKVTEVKSVKVKDIALASESAKNDEEKIALKDIFSTTLKSAAAAENLKYSQYTQDIRDSAEQHGSPAVKTWAKRLNKIDPNGRAFMRDKTTQDPGWIKRILSSPEYSTKGDIAAETMVQAGELADEIKYTKQEEVLGDFAELAKAFEKFAPNQYTKAQKYLHKGDRLGIGFRLKKNKDGKYEAQDRNKKVISTHADWQVASTKLIEAEQKYLKGRLARDAREYVRLVRETMDRSLRVQNEDLQNQIDNAKKYGLAEPRVSDQDSPTISEAIAQSYDLQGTYIPRIRMNKAYYVRLEKEGAPDQLLTMDWYAIKDETSSDLINKIKDLVNVANPFGVGRDIKALQAKGYEITELEPGGQLADEIYDVPGLMTSVENLLNEAEDTSEEDSLEALQHINDIITKNISDIYKTKGNMSSKKSRSENYTEGFEPDITKAVIQHAQRVAAGLAKRTTARQMVNAFTGRIESFEEFKKRTGEDFKAYRAQVSNLKISPKYQKGLYADMRLYMQHVLKPTSRAMRALGYLKAATVVKYLGFRVSSAAINMTNMIAAVPATIAAHTGLDLIESLALVSSAASKYASYRSELPSFKGYRNNLIASPLYKTQKAIKRAGKLITSPVKLTDEEYEIFQEISHRGWDEAHFNIDATQAIQDYAGAKWNEFIASSMYMFGAAEKANRAMTLFAAYKAHQKVSPSLNQEELLQKALHTSNRAHGSYGKATKPWLVQKYPILDMAYMFSKFQHNYVLNMIEQGMDYKNIKSALYMAVSPAVIAGAGASILSGPAIWALQGLQAIGIISDSDDPEEDFYKWTEKNLPKMVANGARHGIAGILGVNFKGSMQSPINDIGAIKDISLWDMAGAPGGVITDMIDAANYARYQEWSKAIEKALPSAFAGPLKAARIADEGVTTKDYSPVFFGQERLKLTATEQALMWLSFNPSRVSAYREKIWHEKQTKMSYAKERADIRRMLRKPLTRGSKPSQKEILKISEALSTYNYRVSKSDPNLGENYLTWPKLYSSVQSSLKPSKKERTRQ